MPWGYDGDGSLTDGGTQEDFIPIAGNAQTYGLFLLDSRNRPVAEWAK